MYIFLFLIEFLIILYFERILWKKWFTPTICLGFPLLVLSISGSFFIQALSFKTIYQPTILIFIFGLLLFWLPSLFFGFNYYYVNKKNNSLSSNKNIDINFLSIYRFIDSFAILTILFYVSLFVFKIDNYVNLGSKSFGSDFLSHGVLAHITVLVGVILPFYILNFSIKDKKRFIITCCLLLILIIKQTRGGVLVPVVAGFLLKSHYANWSRKQIILSLLFVIIGGIVIFIVLNWLTMPSHIKLFDKEYLIFVFTHIVFYMHSGILYLSEIISKHDYSLFYNPKSLFSPFVNLWEFIIGSKNYVYISNYFAIPIGAFRSSNVATFLGSNFLQGGFLIGSIITILIGFISNLFLFLSSIYSSIWIKILYVFILAQLSFGWFESYFIQNDVIEIPLLCLLLNFLYKYLPKNNFVFSVRRSR